MKRADDYLLRREHLRDLSDEQLHERFWNLVKNLTDPLLKAGEENTSPAIERSVLLRMGFNSLEAKALVEFCLDNGLLAHGAGHVVYKLSKAQGLTIREAGAALISGQHH
ncbi:MAG: ornithine aminomutase, partial [Clostridiales bacterium]|nr:ornithine aminomutase [Clostridiales bacterium]